MTHFRATLPALLVAGLTLSTPGSAAMLTNGDFETGNFTGWTRDTDGNAGTTPDFQIIGSPGSYQARIQADYAGDLATLSNTLYQLMNLTAGPGEQVKVSFDWVFAGAAGSPDEDFVVGLGDGTGNYYGADGNLGFLLTGTAYGSGSFSTLLAASYSNASPWTLEFQVNKGSDAAGSYLLLDHIQLDTVPVPAPFLLFAPGLALLAWRRRPTTSRPAQA